MHDSLDGAKSNVFMVTNVRVLHASYNQVLGNWTTDWEYELRAIEGPPSVEFDGRTYFVVIKPREERRPVYYEMIGFMVYVYVTEQILSGQFQHHGPSKWNKILIF